MPLVDLGVRVQLGHNGSPCPAPRHFDTPLTVYHTNGAHMVKVSFCECNEPPGGYLFANHLLRTSWFPASLTLPRTAFTFAVLDGAVDLREASDSGRQEHRMALCGKLQNDKQREDDNIL